MTESNASTASTGLSNGVRPELFIRGDFIVLRMALVDELEGDFEAAIVLQRMMWRCERDGEWQATHAQISAETRLTEWKVRRVLKVLRDRGFIASRRAGAYDPTQIWAVVLHHLVTEESSVTVAEDSSVTSLQDLEDKTPPPPTRRSGTTRRGSAPRGLKDETPKNPTAPAPEPLPPAHRYEDNTRRALAAFDLPLTVDELVVHCYRIGGDHPDGPWHGYREAKPDLMASLAGSRDPARVLRKRLDPNGDLAELAR